MTVSYDYDPARIAQRIKDEGLLAVVLTFDADAIEPLETLITETLNGSVKGQHGTSRWANEIDVANKIDVLMDHAAIGNDVAETEIRRLLWDNKMGFVRLAQSLVTPATLAATPPQASGWKPIETRPDDDEPCWIGDAPTGTMIFARPAQRMKVWYIMWADRLVPWLPTHWHPKPAPLVIAEHKTESK